MPLLLLRVLAREIYFFISVLWLVCWRGEHMHKKKQMCDGVIYRISEMRLFVQKNA